MSDAASRMPQELWSKTVHICLERSDPFKTRKVCGPAAQPTLAAAARVDSIFFLAAIPHLYRASTIKHDLPSFFRGADKSIDLTDKDDGLTDAELVRQGVTVARSWLTRIEDTCRLQYCVD